MAEGSGNVFANGIPVSRIGVDNTAGHCFNPTPISTGSPNVFINNIATDRVGDPIVPHTCPPVTHGGNASNGSPNVFANDGGAGSMTLSPITAQSIVESPENIETRQEDANPYTAAIHSADDEGAPSDVGGDVPLSGNQTYVAAAAQTEGVDISTPPVTDATATVTPSAEVTASGYNYTDIDAAASFTSSFPLSPNFTLGSLTTNCRISKYPLISQTTAGTTYTEKAIVKNLRDLCYNILEPMRTMYGGLIVNSGFRHTKNGKSQHERGQGVDVAFTGLDTNAAAAFTRAQDIANSTLPYDQFIFEQNNTIWFHMSYDRSKPSQRRDVRTKPRGVDKPQPGLFKVV
jgi:hypothetical protein